MNTGSQSLSFAFWCLAGISEITLVKCTLVGKQACPAPAEVLLSNGKDCPRDVSANCLNSNTGYSTFLTAWTQCGQVAECEFIMKYHDGKYYLRRSSDPDVSGQQGIVYSCQASYDFWFKMRVQGAGSKWNHFSIRATMALRCVLAET